MDSLRVFKLPDELRPVLSKPYGETISGADRFTVAYKLKRKASGRKLWSIGDVLTYTLLKLDTVPYTAVVDGRSERRVFRNQGYIVSIYTAIDAEITRISNPPGTISEESIRALCMERRNPSIKRLIIVDGEEDLLTPICILKADMGDIVAYGQPGVGVSVIEVDEEYKGSAEEILGRFVPRDYLALCMNK